MSVILYMTSVTSSRETKHQQSEFVRILETHGAKYETVDISVDKILLGEMREKAGNPSAVPPQLFCGDRHLGGYDQFMEAVEDGRLDQFLEAQN